MERLALMPKYDDYVDSGVEWLGRVPASWELTRLGTRFNERRSKVSDIDYPALSVTKKGVLPQLDNAAKTKDGDNRKLVKEGDFVINSRSDRKGSSGVSDRDGSVSLINIVLKPKGIHPKFSEHLLKSHAFIEEYYRVGRGIVADLWTTRYDEMRTITISVPSLEEQTRIANFLDKKAAQIDDAIAIKEQQISLLRERKQIIIQQAVTQGLDPNVQMKDSGVDWIGKIPAHWVLKKIKHVTSKIGSGVTPTGGGSTYLDDGIPLLRSQNIHFDRIDLTDVARISNKTHEGMSNSKVKKGDVLLNITGGSIGRCYYVDSSDEMNVNQHVCIVRPNKIIKTVFLNAVLASEIGQGQIWYFQQGGGREGLNFQALKNFYIALPPEAQQVEIAEYIDELEKEFYSAIQIQLMQIEKLKEYKTTLINSAVTGKIKITPEMVEQ